MTLNLHPITLNFGTLKTYRDCLWKGAIDGPELDVTMFKASAHYSPKPYAPNRDSFQRSAEGRRHARCIACMGKRSGGSLGPRA